MSDELEKINEIFRTQDEHDAPPAPSKAEKRKRSAVDRLLIDSSGEAARNYTGDAESERDYRPVR